MAKKEDKGNSLLDFLRQMVARPGQGMPSGATSPINPNNPIGTGLAQGAADTSRLYPIWQQQAMQAQMNGEAFPQFADWLQTQGIQQPSNMPR